MTATAERVRAAWRAEPTPMSRRDEWSVVVFGGWMVTGLFLDGWAHGVEKPESFFSPWHLVLYSGFGAAMVFAAIDGFLTRARGERTRMDPLLIAGIVAFAIAGVGDMIWHEIFGVEVDVEALLSPTHLMLMVGGILMATTPVRAAWADADPQRVASLRSFFPTIFAITITVALASFFLMFASAFVQLPIADRGELGTTHGVTSVLVTNLLLLAPLVIVLRRWAPPFGTFTSLFGTVAFAMIGLEGFERPALIVAPLLAGVTADILARRRTDLRLIVTAVPAVMWTAWFVVLAATDSLPWTVELWTGSIVLAVLSGLGLTLIAPKVQQVAADQPMSERSAAAVS